MTPQTFGRIAQGLLRHLHDERGDRTQRTAASSAAANVQLLEPRVLLSGSVLGDAPEAAPVSSGAPVVASFPAGLPVVVFDNGLYVDTTDSSFAESDTLQATLTAQGATVSTFTGLTAADWTTALAGRAVLVIPELENGNLASVLDEDARNVIRRFVNSGGGLIVGGNFDNHDLTVLNTVFGYSLTRGPVLYDGELSSLDVSAADGTAFEGAAATLPALSATSYLATSSLPDGAKSIYNDGVDGTSVALFQEGAGKIAFLGYDWFDASPVGTQDGGWLDILDRAVEELNTHTSFHADFSDGFGNASLDGFTIDNTGATETGLWHLSTGRGEDAGHSADDSLYFGQGETLSGGGNYNVGHTAGRVISPLLDVVDGSTLSFKYKLNVESNTSFDIPRLLIAVNGAEFSELSVPFNRSTAGFEELSVDLSAFAGLKIQVAFDFDTRDNFDNAHEGWYLDDVKVVVKSQPGQLAEPNDSIYQAVQTGINGFGAASFDGKIGDGVHPDGDADFYHFKALAGAVVTLDTDAHVLGSPLDSMIRVYDAAGNVLASNDDESSFTFDSRIQFTAATSGDYYVAVVGYSAFPDNPLEPGTVLPGGSTGDYILNVNVDISTLVFNGTADADTFSVLGELDGSFSVQFNGVTTNYGAGNVQSLTINGGEGSDFISIIGLNDPSLFVTAHGGLGDDTLTVTSSPVTISLYGDEDADSLTGGDGNDNLYGGDGDDTLDGGLGADFITGGDGDDTFLFGAGALGDDVLFESTGIDSLNFLSKTTGFAFSLGTSGPQTIEAGHTVELNSPELFEALFGGAGDDTLTGNAQDNTLIGAGGNDTLSGGEGNDAYAFLGGSDGDDLLNETGAGVDTVFFGLKTANVTFSLATTAVQSVEAGHTVTLNSDSLFEGLYGGEGNDTLTGNAQANLFYGGLGNDTLSGGEGDDTYFFGEGAEGTDLVNETGTDVDTLDFSAKTANLTFSLFTSGVQTVEAGHTVKLNSAALFENLLGGSGNDTLTGNALNNGLSGGAGNDTLSGVGGHDTLGGDLGDDTLAGGEGDDTYVFAAGAEGNDLVNETGTGVDTLDFSAKTTDLTVTIFSSAVQTIEAGHTVKLNSGSIIENIIGGAGNDNFTGNGLNNSLIGGQGNDTLRGFTGNDVLNGGEGNDTYVFDIGVQGADTILDSSGVDHLDFFRKTSSFTFNLGLTGLQTVEPSHTINLGTSVMENITGGSGNDTLIGNSLANVISGSGGRDNITGGLGDDTLSGGEGDDTYIFGAGAEGNDLVNETSGIDHLNFSAKTANIAVNLFSTAVQTVETGHTIKLNSSAQFENVTGGSGNDTLTGNNLNNVLIAGNGNDTLRGFLGGDTLTGGEGNDTYTFEAGAQGDDLVNETGLGIDLLNFSAKTTNLTFSLFTSGVQTLESGHTVKLNGTALFENLIAGSGNDTLTGNNLNNLIFGGAGNDTLTGFDGLDVLIGGTGTDTITGGNGDDLVIANNYTNAANLSALAAIQTEWTNVANNYATRVGRLRGTTPGAAFTLTAVTVPNDGVTDTITGGNNDDWFWGLAGEFTDKQVAESAN